MSVRARPPVPKWGDPLPQLCDARTDQVVGHLIPVEGVALALSAETAHMHAFRRELAVAGAPLCATPTLPGSTGAATAGALDADAPPSTAGHLEAAAAAAAAAGQLAVLENLISAGAVGRTIDPTNNPLVAAARSRRRDAATMLIGAGCCPTEASAQLRIEGAAGAARWVMQL